MEIHGAGANAVLSEQFHGSAGFWRDIKTGFEKERESDGKSFHAPRDNKESAHSHNRTGHAAGLSDANHAKNGTNRWMVDRDG